MDMYKSMKIRIEEAFALSIIIRASHIRTGKYCEHLTDPRREGHTTNKDGKKVCAECCDHSQKRYKAFINDVCGVCCQHRRNFETLEGSWVCPDCYQEQTESCHLKPSDI